jgi:hypothetical protein
MQQDELKEPRHDLGNFSSIRIVKTPTTLAKIFLLQPGNSSHNSLESNRISSQSDSINSISVLGTSV